jgi:hypothetical protein
MLNPHIHPFTPDQAHFFSGMLPGSTPPSRGLATGVRDASQGIEGCYCRSNPVVSERSSSAKPIEPAAVALRWPASLQRFEMRRRLTLLCQLQPQLPARLRLTVERLRDSQRAAHLAELEHLHLKFTSVVSHPQHVADTNLAGRLGSLSLGLNPAEFACPGSERTGLKESRCPKPLVNSHDLILARRGQADLIA